LWYIEILHTFKRLLAETQLFLNPVHDCAGRSN